MIKKTLDRMEQMTVLHDGDVFIDNYTTQLTEYGVDYLQMYKDYAYTELGDKLANWRKAYAEGFLQSRAGRLLDFGCGYSPICEKDSKINDFMKMGSWFGTDCNRLVGELPHMQGRFLLEPSLGAFEVVCFFDVLEHLRNYQYFLNQMKLGSVAVITLPVMTYDMVCNFSKLQDWIHYKPGEHFIYATEDGWIKLVEACGFKLLDMTTYETAMGRAESGTFAFRKVEEAH